MGKRQRRRERQASKRERTVEPQLTSFRIEDVFLPDDPVGHFVIALSAAHNDLVATNVRMFPPDDPDDPRVTSAIRVTLLRRALAQIWETHLLVKEAAKVPAVDAFPDEFADVYPGDKLDGPHLVRLLRGDDGATSPRFRSVLHEARNATNHYPKPATPQIVAAVHEAIENEDEGRVTFGSRMHTLRAEFSDTVLLHAALPDHDQAALEVLIEGVVDTTIAIIHLAQTAMSLWFTDHGVDMPEPPAA